MAWWNPFKPKPQPSPGAGDSSNIESKAPSPPVYQGPQKPGYGFTPGGGSAPIGSGGSSGGSSGGKGGGSKGGGGSSSLPQTYTTTADTGTGYNPATGTNVPERTSPSVLSKLPPAFNQQPQTWAGTNVGIGQYNPSATNLQNMKGNYRGSTSGVAQIGLPVITQSEANTYGLSQPSIIVTPSSNINTMEYEVGRAGFITSNYKQIGFGSSIAQPFGTLKSNQEQIDMLSNAYSFQSNPAEYAKKFPSNVDITTSSDVNLGEVTTYQLKDLKSGGFISNEKYIYRAPVGQQIYSRVEDIGLGVGKVAFGVPEFIYDTLPKNQFVNPEQKKKFSDIFFGVNENVSGKLYSNLGAFGRVATTTLTSPNSIGTYTGMASIIAPTLGVGVVGGVQQFRELKNVYGLTTKQALGGVSQEAVRGLSPISFKTTGTFNFKVEDIFTRPMGTTDVVKINTGVGKSTIGGQKTSLTVSKVSYDTVIPTGLYSTRTISTTDVILTISSVKLTPFQNVFMSNKGITTGMGFGDVTTVGYSYTPKGYYGIDKRLNIYASNKAFTSTGLSTKANVANILSSGKGGAFDIYKGTIGNTKFFGKKSYGGGEQRLYVNKEQPFSFGMGTSKFSNVLKVNRKDGKLSIMSNAGRPSKATSVSTSVFGGKTQTPFGEANVYEVGSVGFTKSGKRTEFADFRIYDITKDVGSSSGTSIGGFKVSGKKSSFTTQISKLTTSDASAISSSFQSPKTTSISKTSSTTAPKFGASNIVLQSIKPAVTTTTSTKPLSAQVYSPLLKSSTEVSQLQQPQQTQMYNTLQNIGSKTNTMVTQRLNTDTSQKTQQTSIFSIPPSPSYSGYKPTFIDRLPPFTIDIPSVLPPMGDFSWGKSARRFKSKQTFKYTPSFGVLAGIQKGKSYSGKMLTGLETRGYGKGFSWAFRESPIKFGSAGISSNMGNFRMPRFNFSNARKRRRRK